MHLVSSNSLESINQTSIVCIENLQVASLVYHTHRTKRDNDKKDGYRQQNVRQRQKLISIIDYDVCMTSY